MRSDETTNNQTGDENKTTRKGRYATGEEPARRPEWMPRKVSAAGEEEMRRQLQQDQIHAMLVKALKELDEIKALLQQRS